MKCGPAPPRVDGNCLASCQVTAVGAGRATYLGRFTRLSCVVVREDGSPEGITEFTAANGDKLCAEVKGQPPILGPTGLTVRGTYTFTGGLAGSATCREGRILWALLRPMIPALISPSTSGESYSTERRTGQRASGSPGNRGADMSPRVGQVDRADLPEKPDVTNLSEVPERPPDRLHGNAAHHARRSQPTRERHRGGAESISSRPTGSAPRGEQPPDAGPVAFAELTEMYQIDTHFRLRWRARSTP